MALATLNEKPYWGKNSLFSKTLFVLAQNLFKVILMAVITPAPSEHLSPRPAEISRHPLTPFRSTTSSTTNDSLSRLSSLRGTLLSERFTVIFHRNQKAALPAN